MVGKMPTLFDSTYTGTNVVVVVLVVVVVFGAFVVGGTVSPTTVLAGVGVVATVVADATMVVGATVVVGASKICSGASTKRARPWKTANTAFILSVVMRGSMTESSPTILPRPSIW